MSGRPVVDARAPWSGLDLLAAAGLLAGLIGLALGSWGALASHAGWPAGVAAVVVALPVVLAGIVAPHPESPRLPPVAATVAALYVVGVLVTPGALAYLAHPALSGPFAALGMALLSGAVVILAGIAATVRHHGRRGHSRRTARRGARAVHPLGWLRGAGASAHGGDT